MLLAEAGRLDVSELLGLDVRPDAVAFAALGTYTPEQLRDVPPALLARHFVPVAGGAQVRPALRARTRWRTGSVFSPTGDGPWDLILFRNVGIYLTPEAGRRAWEGIAGQLAPHGVVLTGTAERPPADLGLRAVAPCCYGAAA
jgi:chemotaxis protein methyltransferase CheR